MSISVTPNYAVLLLLYIYFHFKSPCVALTNCFRGLIPVKVRVSNSDQVPDSDHIFCWSVSSIGWVQKLKRWHWITPKSDGNLCQDSKQPLNPKKTWNSTYLYWDPYLTRPHFTMLSSPIWPLSEYFSSAQSNTWWPVPSGDLIGLSYWFF